VPRSKIHSVEALRAILADLQAGGRRVVFTNGCFDLLHRGHAEYLAQARGCADALLVAVNSDASVRALKGPERPIVSEADRAYLLASLEAVDAVVIFSDTRPLEVFPAVVPDVYVKGGDYTEERLDRDEHAILKGLGCEFRFVPFVQGFSTTGTISRLRQG